MSRKVHFLRLGLYGLFQHLMTYCDMSGDYVRDCWIAHYRTGARFDYTNDRNKVTCLTCLKNMKGD